MLELHLPCGHGRLSRVHIGVLEQPKVELLPQQSPRRFIDARLGDLSLAHKFHDDAGVGDASKLVDSGIERFGIALLDAKVLHAPRHPKRSWCDRRTYSGGSSLQALPATTLGNQPVA